MIKYIILITLFLAPLTAAWTQIETSEDLMVVYLKDGSQIEGYVTKWDYQTSLFMKTTGGSIFEFPADKIDKVVQRSLVNINSGPSYTFNESGQYYSWRVQGIIGNDGARQKETPGYGFSFLAGYRLNRFLGAGIGIGYDKFVNDTAEEVIPVFAEISGFGIPKNTSVSYSLGIGYSFARDNVEAGIVDAKGGLLIYPAVGLRFGEGKLKYTIDLGYKFQKTQFTFRNVWEGSTLHEQRLTYKRLTLRFGILI